MFPDLLCGCLCGYIGSKGRLSCQCKAYPEAGLDTEKIGVWVSLFVHSLLALVTA